MSELIREFSAFKELSHEFNNNIEILFVYENWNFDTNTKQYERKNSNYLIVTKNDLVYAFGQNGSGHLGFGHNRAVDKPTLIDELSHKQIIDFSAGVTHCIARDICGRVYSFGRNQSGVLGIGSKDDAIHKTVLIECLSDKNVIQMSCGEYHSIVLTNCGEVYAWGGNQYSQIGIGFNENHIKPIKLNEFIGEKVEKISCGAYHSLALTENGRVYSWGRNDFGQLGIGHKYETNNVNHVLVKDNEMNEIIFKSISCGLNHSLLLSIDGEVYSFGCNESGELGYKTRENQLSPIKVEINDKFFEVKAYKGLSAAKSTHNKFYAWGHFADDIRLEKQTNPKSFDEIFVNELHLTPNPLKLTENQLLTSMRYSKYKIEFIEHSLIDRGSYGVVFKALNKKTKQVFAVKKIPLTDSEVSNVRIRITLENMEKWISDYVIKYEKSWIENNYYNSVQNINQYKDSKIFNSELFHPKYTHLLFIQMELCLKNLRQVVNQLNAELKSGESQTFTPIGFYISSELMKEILESVQYLHKNNIIHKDLKPENILITDGMNGRFVKIGDFGIADLVSNLDTDLYAKWNTLSLGTVDYSAPEIRVYDISDMYDMKSDVYSLGVIMKELFSLETQESTVKTNDTVFEQKFKKLNEINGRMLSTHKQLRPKCEEILREIFEWTLNLQQLNEFSQLKDFLSKETKYISMDESFHKYFIREKVKHFIKGLNLVKNEINLDKKLLHMIEVYEPLLE